MSLGIFQPFWNIWTQQMRRARELPYEHFEFTMLEQVKEARQHNKDGNADGVNKEWVDMISVALNFLRAQGLSAKDIGELVLKRVEGRYRKHTDEILEKYERRRNA